MVRVATRHARVRGGSSSERSGAHLANGANPIVQRAALKMTPVNKVSYVDAYIVLKLKKSFPFITCIPLQLPHCPRTPQWQDCSRDQINSRRSCRNDRSRPTGVGQIWKGEDNGSMH